MRCNEQTKIHDTRKVSQDSHQSIQTWKKSDCCLKSLRVPSVKAQTEKRFLNTVPVVSKIA